MNTEQEKQEYTMGRTEAETKRLMVQSQLFEEITGRFLKRCGIAPGMKVLDVGSGAGDVSLAVADIVGKDGAVVGVDMNPQILETARGRAEAEHLSNVEFIAGDIREVSLDDDFDAVVGRLVLMYLPSPENALSRLMNHLKPRGIVAFQEAELNMYRALKNPDTPYMNDIVDWLLEVFTRSGADIGMGLKLYGTFLNAGLPAPTMHVEAPVGGSPNWPGYAYAAASFNSMVPLIVHFGIATEEEVDVANMAQRLEKEVRETQRPVVLPTHVTAFAQME